MGSGDARTAQEAEKHLQNKAVEVDDAVMQWRRYSQINELSLFVC
jgi:spermidine synthase